MAQRRALPMAFSGRAGCETDDFYHARVTDEFIRSFREQNATKRPALRARGRRSPDVSKTDAPQACRAIPAPLSSISDQETVDAYGISVFSEWTGRADPQRTRSAEFGFPPIRSACRRLVLGPWARPQSYTAFRCAGSGSKPPCRPPVRDPSGGGGPRRNEGAHCPTRAGGSARTFPVRDGWHEGRTALSWSDGGIRLRLAAHPTRCPFELRAEINPLAPTSAPNASGRRGSGWPLGALPRQTPTPPVARAK